MSQVRKRVRWLWFLLLALSSFAIEPSASYARAGGGESFHSSGGGGGHGGGGAIFDLLWLLFQWIQVCVSHPLIGLPVTIGVIALIYFYSRNGSTAAPVVDDELSSDEEAAAKLRAGDPAFDLAGFYGRVRLAFDRIQASWCAQNLEPVRPFISDGIHERFSIQFEEQKAFGYRDTMADISVEEIRLVTVAVDSLFDVATLRIKATARDFRVSLANDQRISGSTGREPFVEFWSFIRRRGARSQPAKQGLIEGHCPNCGAPLEMNQAANCRNCHALLRSGEYDWVLTEITQQEGWSRRRTADPSGAEQMRQIDPGFNCADLEDLTSVMFWRKTMADRLGKIDPLRKIAMDRFCAAYAESLKPDPDGSRVFHGDCAVGASLVLAVMTGQQIHRAIIEIFWEASRLVARGGALTIGDRVKGHYLFVLQRNAAAVIDPGKSVSSAHCPNCGAPMTDDLSPACQFCGTVINDGSRSWVVSELHPASSPAAQALLRSFLSSRADIPIATAIG